MNESIQVLTDKQQVKVPGASWVSRIFVGTLEGFYGNDPAAVAVGMEKSRRLGHDIAWTMNPGSCITADYPGKAEALAKEEAAFEAAPLLTEGQTVSIEGRLYTVKINGLQYSDPVKFVPKKADDA